MHKLTAVAPQEGATDLTEMTQEALQMGRQQGKVEAEISVLQLVFGHEAVELCVIYFLPELLKRRQRGEPLFHPDVNQSAPYLPAEADEETEDALATSV